MASFRKVKNGWRAEVYVQGTRDSKNLDTKAEAQAWASQRETELRSISGGMGSKTHTVGDVQKTYAEKVSPAKKGERWEVIRLDLIGDIVVLGRKFGEIRLAEFQPAHIAAWRDIRQRGTDSSLGSPAPRCRGKCPSYLTPSRWRTRNGGG